MRGAVLISFIAFAFSSSGQDTIATHAIDTIYKSKPSEFKNAIKKTVKILSYLSYCDAPIGRAISDYSEFECFRGEKIRNIEIRVLHPYGVNIDSPDVYRPTKSQNFANKIQIGTKPQVIRNEVLFNEGDTVNPLLFADTERNLWEKNIYKDIKILIEEVGSNMVDVTFYIRDKWNFGLITSLGYNYINAGVQLNNLFGLSQTLGTDVTFFFRTRDAYRVHVAYSYSNIRSTFINIGFSGSYDIFNQNIGLSITRNFFSSRAQWAGRVAINVSRTYIPYTFVSSELYDGWTDSNSQDFWLAKAFKLNGRLGKKFPLVRLITSARLQRVGYTSRPYFFGYTYNQGFINQTSILGAIGIARWDYYVDKNVYSLDRSEYFTKGLSMAFIGGFQEDEILQRRTYMALAFQYGKSFEKAGYLLSYLKVGGFATPRSLDQVLIDWQNTFYTRNIALGRWNMRHFFVTNCKWGLSRPTGKEIVVNNDNGLRGVTSAALRGSKTYGFSYEIDMYYTRKVIGFTSSYFVFSDLSLVQQAYFRDAFQSGIGAGLRLRNENLGLGFIEITFVYYPHLEILGQNAYTIMANTISNRTPIKKDLLTPDILNVD